MPKDELVPDYESVRESAIGSELTSCFNLLSAWRASKSCLMHGGMDVLRSISIELNVSRPSAEEKSASEIVLPNDFKIGTVK